MKQKQINIKNVQLANMVKIELEKFIMRVQMVILIMNFKFLDKGKTDILTP